MTTGRPKITLDDLPEGWRDEMIALAEDGASDVELRVTALGNICHETWTRLIEEEPLFSETVKECRALCEVWWLRLGRKGASAVVDINPTTWIFNMKNRFAWKDKQELSGDKDQPLVPVINVTVSGD